MELWMVFVGLCIVVLLMDFIKINDKEDDDNGWT